MFMKTVLFNMVKNFKISTSMKYENLEYEIAVTMKFAQKYNISLAER